MRHIFSLTVMALLFMQVGCATDPTYQPKAVSEQDGAVIRTAWCGAHNPFKLCDVPNVSIMKVDGIRAIPWSPSHLYQFQIVDPGERTITVSGSIATDIAAVGIYSAEAKLSATFKTGHTYLIHGEWLLPVMSFWIEDKSTGEIVSEKQAVNAEKHMEWMNLIPRK